MKKILPLIIAVFILSCSTKKVYKQDIEGIEGGKIITTITPSKNKKCDEEIVVDVEAINFSKEYIVYSVKGGRIKMKNFLFYIKPLCESKVLELRLNYKINDSLISIQTIDLSEFIDN